MTKRFGLSDMPAQLFATIADVEAPKRAIQLSDSEAGDLGMANEVAGDIEFLLTHKIFFYRLLRWW